MSWDGQGGDSGCEVGTLTGKGTGWGWLVSVCLRGVEDDIVGRVRGATEW